MNLTLPFLLILNGILNFGLGGVPHDDAALLVAAGLNRYGTDGRLLVRRENIDRGLIVARGRTLATAKEHMKPRKLNVESLESRQMLATLNPGISVRDVTVNENAGYADIQVDLSDRGYLDVRISYSTANGSARSGSDYQSAHGTLTIKAGQRSGTIRVPIVDDATAEATEHFFVNLGRPNWSNLNAFQSRVTIRDNDTVPAPSPIPVRTPNVSIADVSGIEGTTLQFQVTLSSHGTRTVRVDYQTRTGTASNNDFNSTGGRVTFAPGETEKLITVQTRHDSLVEADEQFTVQLSNARNSRIVRGTATGAIIDNDVAPPPAPTPAPTTTSDPPPVPDPPAPEPPKVPNTYGTIDVVGPRAIVRPNNSIIVTPNMSASQISTLVANSASNATFWFQAGTYTDVMIQPKAGQTFVAQLGTVLTSSASNGKRFAFGWHTGQTSATAQITIKNFVIDGYAPPYQQASIQGSSWWNIDGVEVKNSKAAGIEIGSNSKVINSHLHHNRQLNVKAVDGNLEGHYAENVLIHNNLITHGNHLREFSNTGEFGNSKFWNVNGLTITNNVWASAQGDGIWMDGNLHGGNRNVEIAWNIVRDNTRYGIYQELGGYAWVHHNLIEGNGQTDGAGAAVFIAASNGAWGAPAGKVGLIEHNVMRNNHNAVSLLSQLRSDSMHRLQNWRVRYNTIEFRSGIQGVSHDHTLSSFNPYSVNSLSFDHNTYSGPVTFDWGGSWKNWSQWRGFAQDTHGTLSATNPPPSPNPTPTGQRAPQ